MGASRTRSCSLRSHRSLSENSRFDRGQARERTKHQANSNARHRRVPVVVPGLEDQDGARFALESAFFADASPRVIDRRERPSHGYRAIHLVVLVRDRSVEIQLRTALQHLWAELCEKLADGFGSEIKYGGGSDQVRALLQTSSQRVAEIEGREQQLFLEDADFDIQPPETKAERMPALGVVHRALERDRVELMEWLRSKIASAQRDRLNRGIH